MSNTVYCKLSACGSDPEIERFVQSCSSKAGDHFSFRGLIPPPVEKPGPEWRVCNWSSSSDAREYSEFVISPGMVDITFEVAHYPPQEWLSAAANVFPSLTFLLSWVDLPDGGSFWAEDGQIQCDTMVSSENKVQDNENTYAHKMSSLCYHFHHEILASFPDHPFYT